MVVVTAILQMTTTFIHLIVVWIPYYTTGQAPTADRGRKLTGKSGRALAIAVIGQTTEGDLPVVEIDDLTNACAKILATRGAADETCGQAHRQLIRVADSVNSGKAIVTVKLVVAEGQFRRIKTRQVGLIFELLVKVKHSRFKCVHQRCTEPVEITLEEKSHIEAAKADFTLWLVIDTDLGITQIVLCVTKSTGKCCKSPGPVERQTKVRLDVQTISDHLTASHQIIVIPIETDITRIQRPLQCTEFSAAISQ